ncbi:MAG: hypothetical protein EOR97_17315 [Mesorhizobium sp.]|uniref:hypothetical protein n=1 Tax=Mesorhizobium sp. TaxID=1871066 RepID=UPI000FE4FF03|nr:hypothetical protein [Mesorhizobium sp.]RWN30131.1 MAG: hypothetical protein EOR97_17315 [Mesorhizobium sp.]
MSEASQPEDESEDAQVPGLAGAVVSAVNSGIGKSLFGPTAKAVGDYWGERTNETLDRWRAERSKNATSHVAAVMAVEGPSTRSFSESRAQLQEEWLEGAEKIDPVDEPELASLWRASLAAIMKGDPYAEEMVKALRDLSPLDALNLLRFQNHSRADERNPTAYYRLEQRALIVRQMFFGRLFVRMGTMALAICIGMVVAAIWFQAEIATALPNVSQKTLSLTLMGLAVALALATFQMVGNYRFTPLGAKLRAQGDKYFKAVEPSRKPD